MLDLLSSARNLLGHFHPVLVHFPVALLLTGAALEGWSMAHHGRRSSSARTLLFLGTLGAIAAIVSGLSIFHAGDFQGKTLEVARIHRVLGLATAAAAVLTLLIGVLPRGGEPRRKHLAAYRSAYLLTAILVGLAGHYGGWVVFGWGWIWTRFASGGV